MIVLGYALTENQLVAAAAILTCQFFKGRQVIDSLIDAGCPRDVAGLAAERLIEDERLRCSLRWSRGYWRRPCNGDMG